MEVQGNKLSYYLLKYIDEKYKINSPFINIIYSNNNLLIAIFDNSVIIVDKISDNEHKVKEYINNETAYYGTESN